MTTLTLAADGNTVFAGTSDGKVLRSAGGLFSETSSVSSQPASISAILVGSGSVFVGLSEGGVFVSADQGGSFREIGTGLPRGVLCLAAGGDRLWAGTRSGLFSQPRSPAPQPGAKSTLPPRGPRSPHSPWIPRNPARIACGASRRVGLASAGDPKGADSWLYWSADGGKTFSEIAKSAPAGDARADHELRVPSAIARALLRRHSGWRDLRQPRWRQDLRAGRGLDPRRARARGGPRHLLSAAAAG